MKRNYWVRIFKEFFFKYKKIKYWNYNKNDNINLREDFFLFIRWVFIKRRHLRFFYLRKRGKERFRTKITKNLLGRHRRMFRKKNYALYDFYFLLWLTVYPNVGEVIFLNLLLEYLREDTRMHNRLWKFLQRLIHLYYYNNQSLSFRGISYRLKGRIMGNARKKKRSFIRGSLYQNSKWSRVRQTSAHITTKESALSLSSVTGLYL